MFYFHEHSTSDWLKFNVIPFEAYAIVNVLLLIASICLYCGIFRVKPFNWPEFPILFLNSQAIWKTAFECIYDYWTPHFAVFAARALRNRPNYLYRWQWKHQAAEKACESQTDFSKRYASDRIVSRFMDMCVCEFSLFFSCGIFSSHYRTLTYSHRCLGICVDANDFLFHENAGIQETSTICSAVDAFNKSYVQFGCITIHSCLGCVLFRPRRRRCASSHENTQRVAKKIKEQERKKSKCILRSEVIT